MGSDLIATDRVLPTPKTSATDGRIKFAPIKAAWIIGHAILACVGIIWFTSASAIAVFVTLTAVTICAGHSVGMHRLLIHRSFRTKRIVEYTLVWLGTLVGMAGPMGMIRAHDLRDWHQRQAVCPPHPAHGAGLLRDAWWQLCCHFDLVAPPDLRIEPEVANDRVYRVIEANWMAQQVPLAVVLFAIGGWAWVLWGISVRITVSLVGHWMVGHFAHKRGHQGWHVDGVPVQGYNLPKLGLITFGENWHGNHHAFPHSAKLGVEAGQFDPGYVFIRALETVGLAWDVQLPDSAPARDGLKRIGIWATRSNQRP